MQAQTTPLISIDLGTDSIRMQLWPARYHIAAKKAFFENSSTNGRPWSPAPVAEDKYFFILIVANDA